MPRTTPTPLDRQLGRVRRRLFVQTLLAALAWGWTATLALTALWFLAQPYLLADAPAALRWYVLGSAVAAGTLGALAWAVLRAPSAVAAALAFDERFGLKERVTTALTLGPLDITSPAGLALLADVNNRLAPLRVGECFPVRPPRSAALVPVLALLLVLLALFYNPSVPQGDAATEPQLATEPAVKADIERKLRQLQKKGERKPAADKPKSDELQRLEAELDKLAKKPHETREQAREVVKDLTDVQDQVHKREKELAERADALREQMRQLDRLQKKQAKEGPARNLERALDRADFKKAKEEADRLGKQLQADEQADRLRKKIKEEKLTEEQKQEAREQLERLGAQELTGEQRQQAQQQLQDIQDKLERLTRGEEAKERLRQLHRQGALSQEQLDRELDQLESNCSKLDDQTKKALEELAQKLKEARQCMKEGKDGEAAEKLKEAGECLAKLDPEGECRALAQQRKDLEAARLALCQALDGRPVPASGRRPESKEGPTGSVEDWAHSDFDKGRLQVIDHVPGDGFKGPRKPAEMSEDIRRAAQEAPEAIDRQRLPNSAGDMARGYFDKLRGPDKK